MFRLSKRPGSSVWQVRKRWPRDVAALLPGEFTRSTGEGDKRRAQEQLPLIAAEYERRVKDARDRLADNSQRDLSAAEVARLAAKFYADALPMMRSKRRLEPLEAETAIRNARDMADALAGALGRRDYGAVHKIADGLIEREGLPVPVDSPSREPLYALLQRALIELNRGAVAELEGRTDYTPADEAVRPLVGVGARDRARTVADLIDAYEKAQGAHWRESTRASYATTFRLLRDLWASRPVAGVTRQDARDLMGVVVALPANMGKKPALRGLTVPEAVKAADALGLPRIQPVTVNNQYLVNLGALFGWASREGWITANPFAKGLRVADPVADEDRRDPFSIPQLQTLFGQAPWKPRDDAPGGKPSRFWVPLLALFTGARLAELAGLRVADVGDQEGIPVLDIRPHEQRGTKTAASRRAVPIRPELVRMGFLAFVEQRRAEGGELLFPECRPNGRGQVGRQVYGWFGKLIAERGLTGKALGTHSFRHLFEDRIREAGLEGTGVALRLTGRTKSGSARTYGAGNSTRELAAALARVEFPGLDLSHLYVADGPASDG